MSNLVTDRELQAHLRPIHHKLDKQGAQLDEVLGYLAERRGVRKFVKGIGGGVTLLALVVSSGWWIPALIH